MSYGYYAAQEELEIEFNARFDYVSEAYGNLGDDPEVLRHEAQAQWEEDMVAAQDDMEARGGPDFNLPFAHAILF